MGSVGESREIGETIMYIMQELGNMGCSAHELAAGCFGAYTPDGQQLVGKEFVWWIDHLDPERMAALRTSCDWAALDLGRVPHYAMSREFTDHRPGTLLGLRSAAIRGRSLIWAVSGPSRAHGEYLALRMAEARDDLSQEELLRFSVVLRAYSCVRSTPIQERFL